MLASMTHAMDEKSRRHLVRSGATADAARAASEPKPSNTLRRRLMRRFCVTMRRRAALEAPVFCVIVDARSIAAARHRAQCLEPDACVLRVERAGE
jgi:hypothetical protein